jgi:hypothetical protein
MVVAASSVVSQGRRVPQKTEDPTNVVVQLGPKATKMIIQVFDADTNDQIENAAVELRRPGDPAALFHYPAFQTKRPESVKFSFLPCLRILKRQSLVTTSKTLLAGWDHERMWPR